MYFVLFVWLGATLWPDLVRGAMAGHPVTRSTQSLLAALSLLSGIGLRYPLQMLPLIFFEWTWKTIWLIAVGLPLWSTHQLDAQSAGQATACLIAMVICPIAIPWSYVVANYVKKPGDRWTGRREGK